MQQSKKQKDNDVSDQESDRDEEGEDTLMDIDGFQKSRVTSYGVSDSEIEVDSSNNVDADQTQH